MAFQIILIKVALKFWLNIWTSVLPQHWHLFIVYTNGCALLLHKLCSFWQELGVMHVIWWFSGCCLCYVSERCSYFLSSSQLTSLLSGCNPDKAHRSMGSQVTFSLSCCVLCVYMQYHHDFWVVVILSFFKTDIMLLP